MVFVIGDPSITSESSTSIHSPMATSSDQHTYFSGKLKSLITILLITKIDLYTDICTVYFSEHLLPFILQDMTLVL